MRVRPLGQCRTLGWAVFCVAIGLALEASSAPPAGAESPRREALGARAVLVGQPILFVVRKQYRPDHHNTETMFQTGEINTGSFEGGGALKSIELGPDGQARVKTLLEVPQGVVRDPDVHFDGRKILVSLRRNREDDYHIYELNADGTGLVQLTFGAGVSDIDPIYLPSGEILFTSTREPKYCMCNRQSHMVGVRSTGSPSAAATTVT